jgi:hypothetical protein
VPLAFRVFLQPKGRAPMASLVFVHGVNAQMHLHRLGASQPVPRFNPYCNASVVRIVRLTVSASPSAGPR